MRTQSECSCKSKTFICTIFESVFLDTVGKMFTLTFLVFVKFVTPAMMFLPVYSDGYHGGKEWVSMYHVMHFVCDLNN